jgi:HAMP domain-containing protein
MALMKQFHLSPASLHNMFTERLHFVVRSAGVAGALLGASVCFFLMLGIIRPLRDIVEMTVRVADSDRVVRLPATGPDEVKRLAGAFYELVHG